MSDDMPKSDSSVYLKPTPASGMPAQPTTKPLPRVETVTVSGETVNALLAEMKGLRDDVREIRDDFTDVKGDIRELKGRVFAVEERQSTHSGGARELAGVVREESSVNLKQDAAIAEVITRVDRIETKTDAQTAILERLESGAKALIASPHVKLLVGILWTGLLGYLASKGWVSK